MKKGVFILCLAICVLFTVSSVCASDVNDTAIASDDTNQAIEEVDDGVSEIDNEVISSSQEDIIGEVDNGTFTALQKKINDADDGSTITLENDYVCNWGEENDMEGIEISKSLTIDGKCHTINGNSLTRIFYVSDGNVVFKNIIFVNSKMTWGPNAYGGTIYGPCTAINCTFDSNSAMNGGAMYYGNAVNCTFKNNIAEYAGALFKGSAVNCTFINNKANYEGGAIHSTSAVNCTFINNKANYEGGAMYYENAENCTFINNKANYGGAMYGVSAVNCAFDSNSAIYGGAMDRGSAKNCTFNSNSASTYGGAMYYGNAENCTFDSNSAPYGGAMYYGNAVNCTFKNNKANDEGGAISATGYVATKCQFINNTAKNGGAIYLMTANECNFTQNTATEYGGAMYGGANNTCIFNHNKAGVSGDDTYHEKAILIVNNFTSTYKSGDKLLFNFTTTEGLPIDDARITIRLYRNNTLVYNDLYALSGEGWVVNVVAGFYNAVYSVENQVYQVNPVNATLKIDKANSTLTISDIIFDYDDEGSITVLFDGATGVIVEVNQEKAVINVKYRTITVSNLDVGTYTLTVTTIADYNHNPITKTANITVNKIDSTLSVNDMVFDYNGKGSTTISYAGANGVTAKVANQPNAVVNVKDNTITVSNLNVGTYTLSVTTIADNNHNPVTKTATITVNKVSENTNTNTQTATTNNDNAIKLTLKTVKVKKSAKKLVLQATLKINGKAKMGLKVIFKFNGKKYTAKTNKKGIAKVTIKKNILKKLKVGKKVKYQASYGKTTVKKTVKIKK